MNTRKLFNIPSKAQKELLKQEEELIVSRCIALANSENLEQRENQKSHDSRCPNCNGKDIVNKISHVQGKGSIDGLHRFGFGSVKGTFLIDTGEVNHCKTCGNEWIKYKIKYATKDQILRVTFRYFDEILTNPKEKRYPWKQDALKIFDECTAEAIHRLCRKSSNNLTLRILRRYYRTVYENGNKKILEKL